MKRKIRQNKYFILVAMCMAIFVSSCKKILETPPEDSQTREEFWSYKGDVEAAMIGVYDALQGCIWKFFVWGEIRGELLETNGSAELENFAGLNIDSYNGLCKWNELYSAINKVNTVIKFAPVAAERDNTFSSIELDEYLGECFTLRALLYFYLTRTFIEFPYITEPSDNDQQDYNVPPSSADEVLDKIIDDLLAAESMVKKEYTDDYFEKIGIKTESIKLAYRKGRVSKPVVWALLTDAYLTKGDYENVVKYADFLINRPGASLESVSYWHDNIFAVGNSIPESIFELQYNNVYDETSDIASWFISSLGDGVTHFINQENATTQTFKYWEGDNPLDNNAKTKDKRGINGQFLANDKEIVWKWAGISNIKGLQRDRSSEDANWIFYRLADIILMKAEALNRLQRTDEAINELNIVRKRAAVSAYKEVKYQVNEIEGLILDERARELAAEGKRWFDLVRIAKRQNNYEIIGNRIAEARASSTSSQSVWKGKVYEPFSWYLPIHKDEIELNNKLEQNPYYLNR